PRPDLEIGRPNPRALHRNPDLPRSRLPDLDLPRHQDVRRTIILHDHRFGHHNPFSAICTTRLRTASAGPTVPRHRLPAPAATSRARYGSFAPAPAMKPPETTATMNDMSRKSGGQRPGDAWLTDEQQRAWQAWMRVMLRLQYELNRQLQ